MRTGTLVNSPGAGLILGICHHHAQSPPFGPQATAPARAPCCPWQGLVPHSFALSHLLALTPSLRPLLLSSLRGWETFRQTESWCSILPVPCGLESPLREVPSVLFYTHLRWPLLSEGLHSPLRHEKLRSLSLLPSRWYYQWLSLTGRPPRTRHLTLHYLLESLTSTGVGCWFHFIDKQILS